MFPRWMSWIFLGVMAYLIYAGTATQRAVRNAEPTPLPQITSKNHPTLAKLTDMERWKRSLNPDYAATHTCALDEEGNTGPGLKVTVDKPGTGDPSACGQEITLRLTLWKADGSKALERETTLLLGAQQIAAGVDAGLVGIRIGEARTLLLPPMKTSPTTDDKPAANEKEKPKPEHEALRKALPQGEMVILSATRIK